MFENISDEELQEIFIDACRDNIIDVVRQLLLDKRIDPSSCANRAIIVAASHGRIEIVRLLSGDVRVNPGDLNNTAIAIASMVGHLDIVRFLLADQRVDPADANNIAIISAANQGHLAVVRELLADQRVDPAAQDNLVITRAAAGGHLEIVRLLLADQRVNPAALNNIVIGVAAAEGNVEVVRELLADQRVNPTSFINEADTFVNEAATVVAIEHNNFDIAYILALRFWPDINNIPASVQEHLPAIKEAGKTYCEQFIARHELSFTAVSDNDGGWPSLCLLRNSEDMRKLKCENATSLLSTKNDELLDSIVLPIQREAMPRGDFETKLSNACRDGDARLVQELLLDKMASPAKKSQGVLNKALLNGHYEVAALLMIHDLTEQHTHLDFSSVFKAREGGDTSFDIDAAIYWTSVYGDVDITKMLIKSSKVDKDSSNLIFYFKNALSRGHHEVAYLLGRHMWQVKEEFRAKVRSYSCMRELRLAEENLNRCIEEENLSKEVLYQEFNRRPGILRDTTITVLEFIGQGTLCAYGEHLRHISARQAESQVSLSGGGGGVTLVEQEERVTKRSRTDISAQADSGEGAPGEDDFAIAHMNTEADEVTAEIQDGDNSRRVGGRVKCLW